MCYTTESYEDDVSAGTAFSAGSGVSPSGTQPSQITASNLSTYANTTARDSAHDFDSTEETVVIDATTLSVTLNEAGTWMLTARIRIDYSEATYAADNQPANLKLRRTNNTPTDIPETTVEFILRDVTTAYFTAGVIQLPIVFYTTTATNDVIALRAWLDALPDNTGAGNGKILAYEASLVAVRVA